MRDMVLDLPHVAFELLAGEAPLELRLHPDALALVAKAVQDERKIRTPGREITELLEEIGARVLVQRDDRNVGEFCTDFAQAVADGLGRESGPMLDAPEALFFRSRDQVAVAD